MDFHITITTKFNLGDRVSYIEDPNDIGTIVDINLVKSKKRTNYFVWYTVKWDEGSNISDEKIEEFVESQLVPFIKSTSEDK